MRPLEANARAALGRLYLQIGTVSAGEAELATAILAARAMGMALRP